MIKRNLTRNRKEENMQAETHRIRYYSKSDGKTYDYYVKNWGTEKTKETETGRTVVKEYGTTVDGKEDKEDFEIILDDGTGFKNI